MTSTVAAWPTVALGEVLRKSDEWIDILPDAEYAQITVRLWGKGAILRGRVQGGLIASPRQLRVQCDQFILSRIDARNGAFGLVTPELDGAVVSNDFPVFNLDQSRIMPAYLHWMSKTHDFVEMCQHASEGTTNRVRLKEDRFLAASIPLPPLDEQRRIVARIEALAACIAEARALRQAAMEETEALALSEYDAAFRQIRANGRPMVSVEDVEVLVTSGPRNFSSRYDSAGSLRFYRAQDITSDGHITDLGAVFVDPPDDMTTRAIVEHGDVLVVITGATIGRTAVISPGHPRGLVSQHVGLVRVDSQKLNPSYLHYAILAPAWAGGQLNELRYGQGKPGLNLANLRALRVPLPPLTEQARLVSHLDSVSTSVQALKCQQAEAVTELDALLPSLLDRAFRGEL